MALPIEVDLAAGAAGGLRLVEQQAPSFDRFVQADGSATRAIGGVGLGLAITRSLVEMMGGAIRLRSAPGQGASFMVELPLAAAASEQYAVAA